MDVEVLQRAVYYWLRKRDLDKVEELMNITPATRKEITKGMVEMWQERFDKSLKGRRLYQFLPSVSARLRMKFLQPSRGLTQFLTRHGPFAQYLCERQQKPTDLLFCLYNYLVAVIYCL